MDSSNQTSETTADPAAVAPAESPQTPTAVDGDRIAEVIEEIDALVDLDPAAAADPAIAIADELGRVLEEEER